MALSANVNWDVRTTGVDTNGGGFDSSVTSPGTDYSQQSAAQIAFTDLVIGVTTTQLTSAANPFTSLHVGNIINITGGTGFTVGRYTVTAVSAGVATMDRAVGTASSTAGIGNLGGSFLTIQAANTAAVAGNTVYIQTGTYTFSAVMNVNVSPLTFWGYQTTHLDVGTPPTLTTASAIHGIFVVNGANLLVAVNLTLTSTNTSANGFYSNNSAAGLDIIKCKISGFNTGIDGDFAIADNFTAVRVFDSEITGCVSHGIQNNNASLVAVFGSYIHGNGGNGIFTGSSGQAGSVYCFDSIVSNNTGGGIIMGTGGFIKTVMILRSTVSNNGGSGFDFSSGFSGSSAFDIRIVVQNTILYGNGGWGVNGATTFTLPYLQSYNNAYGSNTSGAKQNFTDTNAISLTANPFVNGAAGNYALNSAAGGGALLVNGAGPGVYPGGTSTAYSAVGAVGSQNTGGSGSAGGSYPFVM